MLFTLEIYYFMLERIEIKKLVKQAVSRDPPLNWYLYHMCIYGRFISKLTDYVSSFCLRTARSYETLINNIISGYDSVNFVLDDHKYERRSVFEGIYYY
jgi:hypothetical protein